MPLDLVLWLTLISSNYPCLELIFMVANVFEPLKFDRIRQGWNSLLSINGFRFIPNAKGGGRVERRCWVNLQCRGVLLVWMIVGQGLIALAVGAGGVCLDIFSLIYLFSFLSPSLWETAGYRLKYCLKGPLNPKEPTNQPNAKGV